MVQTVQKLWSPQLVLPLSVSVHGRLSSGNVSQMTWTTCISGDGDLAASSFSVSCVLGVWRKVSSHEVLRLFFCERRMRLLLVQFLLFAVVGSGSRILLLGHGC